ncbi:MAG: hypothetical protein WAK57_17155 [Desulfobacterales bacterium]
MNARFTKRWVLVVVVWSAAGLLTLWNTTAINRLVPQQAAREQTRMDADYCRRQAARVAAVVEKQASYYHAVAAPNLGLLAAQETLRSLAQSLGLSFVKAEPAAGQPSPEGVALALRFVGSLADGNAFLALLEQRCPYLPSAAVKIAADPATGFAEFDISLHYRYRVVAAPRAAAGSAGDAI